MGTRHFRNINTVHLNHKWKWMYKTIEVRKHHCHQMFDNSNHDQQQMCANALNAYIRINRLHNDVKWVQLFSTVSKMFLWIWWHIITDSARYSSKTSHKISFPAVKPMWTLNTGHHFQSYNMLILHNDSKWVCVSVHPTATRHVINYDISDWRYIHSGTLLLSTVH